MPVLGRVSKVSGALSSALAGVLRLSSLPSVFWGLLLERPGAVPVEALDVVRVPHHARERRVEQAGLQVAELVPRPVEDHLPQKAVDQATSIVHGIARIFTVAIRSFW